MAGCNNARQPSLECALTEQALRSSEGRAEVAHVLNATLEASDLTDGVWSFSGHFTTSAEGRAEEPVRGYYYEYLSGDFDLVAWTQSARITVMPSNETLKERGLQGVIMRNGQTVSTGRPVTASCELQQFKGQ